MIREINKDQLFLSLKSIDADKNDKQIINDLIDTLKYHSNTCVGMAANMIGINKNIIAISIGIVPIIMINPKITYKAKPYNTKESCLSLTGERQTKRYKEIEVDYLDTNFNKQHGKYSDFVAEVIQHEIDHLHGIII